MPDPQNTMNIATQLTRLKREGEERQAQRTSQKFGYPYVDLTKVPATVEALGLIPETMAKDAKIAAIEVRARRVAVAAANPDLPAVKKAVKDLEARKYEVKMFVTSLSGLEAAWKMYRFVKQEAGDITGKVSIEKKRIEELTARLTSFAAIKEEIKRFDFLKAGPVQLIEVILAGALALRASDIHL